MADKRDSKKTDEAAAAEGSVGERIAKVMARAGLCSRRDAEAWIAAGRVALNGKKLSSPAVNVGPNDLVLVDGKPLPEAEKTRLFRYHKPRGLVTTAKDPEGRPTVFDNLPEGLPRVISVGRLDLNSEGLLLLTNDGELARRLELPATGWVRRYRVRVNGRIDPASLTRLAKGIEIEGIRYGAIEAVLDRQQGDNAWLTMSLTEGKNREIRKVCAFFGWTVSRLIRLSYGPFQLGHLEKGEFEEVPAKVLRDQLGRPGGAEPLRPHQASGGKARPPKQKPEERRTKRASEERPERSSSQRSHRDDRRPAGDGQRGGDQRGGDRHQAGERRNAGQKPPRQAERRADFDQSKRADRQHTDRQRPDRKSQQVGARHEERPQRAAYRAASQSAETLGASLRQALDRASREERAEELQNRTARPGATGPSPTQSGPADSRKPVPASSEKKSKGPFKGQRAPRGKPVANKPDASRPDVSKPGANKSGAYKARSEQRDGGRRAVAIETKPDSSRPKKRDDRRSERLDNKPANRNGKHAHRQRRP